MPDGNSLSVLLSSTPDPNQRIELRYGRGWLSAERSLVKFRNRNDANGYYQALGLNPDATKDEIKARFRKLVKKLHPDVGGDEDLYRFIVEIANVLLNDESKFLYDSTTEDSLYIGPLEREELMRDSAGQPVVEHRPVVASVGVGHWAFFTDIDDEDSADRWIWLCREVSPAVGYRGKIRVGVLETDQPWSIVTTGDRSFLAFQRGLEPNRLHALSAMIEWQKFLIKQVEGYRPTR